MTAAGLAGGSLADEGGGMLAAVVEDLRRIPGVQTMTAINPAWPQELGHVCVRIPQGAEESTFKRLAQEADLSLVIAPEFEDLLSTRCRWVLEAGGRLLGSSLE